MAHFESSVVSRQSSVPVAETLPQPAPDPRPAPERQESLVIQTSFIGDVILTTGLIAELAMRGPVDVVVTPGAAKVLENNPGIRHLHVYDKRSAQSGMAGLWRMGKELRGRRDAAAATTTEATAALLPRGGGRRARRIAYLAQGSVRSAVLAAIAGCRERVGFSTSAGRALYTVRVEYRDDVHHAERLWRLAFAQDRDVRPPPGAIVPRVYPSASDVAAVDALLAPLAAGERLIALAPGSVWETKRWPYYAELAQELAAIARIAIVGGPDDTEAAQAIVAAAGAGRAIDATGKLSLLGSAELIRRAACIVTNDSSPTHLASAVGTPTITIFGPTVPDFGFGPLAPHSTAAGHDALPCRPCHHHGPRRCPLGHWKCMRDVAPSEIRRIVGAVVSRQSSVVSDDPPSLGS